MEQIVIVGYGWVGQANAVALKKLGHDVSFFDPNQPDLHYADTYSAVYESIPRLTTLLEKDSEQTWYIVCVGDVVAPDGFQDISRIEAALDSLSGAKGGVILRSTIVPDTLEKLSFDYYVPEFLHEVHAVEECIDPFYMVIGIGQNQEGKPLPAFLKAWSAQAHKTFIGTPREASFIKYLSNTWNALRIAFVNEFATAIAEPDSDEHLETSNRVIDFLFEKKSYLRYGRSFGGHCLPKDMRALLRWGKDSGKHLDLLAGAYAANELHAEREKKYPALPTWLSTWQRTLPSGRVALRALRVAVMNRVSKPLR